MCAVTIDTPTRHVYTGGRGCVKMWNIEGETPQMLHKLDCLQKSYVRSCKLVDNKLLLVGGESNTVRVFDMEAPGRPVCLLVGVHA